MDAFLVGVLFVLAVAVVWLAVDQAQMREVQRQQSMRYTNTRNLLSRHLNDHREGVVTKVRHCRHCHGIMHRTPRHREWECEECGSQEVSGYEPKALS